MCIRAQEFYISIYTPYLLNKWTAVAVKTVRSRMTIRWLCIAHKKIIYALLT